MGVHHQPGGLILDRDDELVALGSVIARTATGAGRLVVLEGAAGTGKSTLMQATGDLARSAGLRVLSARGGELERDYPFGVMRQLFEPALAESAESERERLLAGAAGPAAWALGTAGQGTGAQAAGFAAMHALYWLTANVAAQGPLLLAVDDAHWADASSLRALDFLARRVTDAGVTLAVALRAEEPGAPARLLDELRATPDGLRLSLGALPDESVQRVVRSRLPDASDELCRAAQRATAGNPLLLQELLRALDAGNGLPAPSQVLEASVPSLGDRVIRRVGRVAADAPALARAMALLGDGGRLATAAALAEVQPEPAGRIAHQLRRIEVLAAEDPFAFVHPLVRRSIYDGIPAAERQRDHERAARLLGELGAPTAAVAAQLRELTPSGSSEVARTMVRAAEQALDHAAADEAVGWLQRALDEQAPDPPRGQLLARLGLAKTVLRDPAAIPLLREAHQLEQEPGPRSELAGALAELLAHAGAWGESVAILDQAELDLAGADPGSATALAALAAAALLYDPARTELFTRRRPEFEALAGGSEWSSHALAALLASETAYRGLPEESRRWREQALRDGRLLRERGGGDWATPQLLCAFVVSDEVGPTGAAIADVDAVSRRSGSVFGTYAALAASGWLHSRSGNLIAAEADLSTFLSLSREAAISMGVANAAFFLADVLLERPSARAIADQVEEIELGVDFLQTWSGAMLLDARGRLRIARNARERGIEDLRAAGRIAGTLRFGPVISTWRSALAVELAISAEGREEAVALAEEELALAQATGLPRPEGVALRTLGVLDRGSQGIERLEASVARLALSPARLEHARSLVELGSALRRANHRADARPTLVTGLELARTCGADRLTERAEQELLAAGGKRRRREGEGRLSLTASELRVAELAVSGGTNAEIAQTLYVTVKTIETHLSRVYAKLGLAGSGSRSRLAQALGEADQPP